MTGAGKTCVIWRVTDGRRGHEQQTGGLVQALQALLPVTVVDVPRWPWWRAIGCGFRSRSFSAAAALPPDLIIGAGHGTHLTLLAAQRAYGGKTVVLMKPSLPLGCFDLCLIPEHDHPRPARNVLTTRGAINAIQPASRVRDDCGLILIGGDSPHYRWDNDAIVEQVRRIVAASDGFPWALTTSPRTPPATGHALRALRSGTLEIMPFDEANAGWLPAQLARVAQVWVTPDSVSMVYEALTSGAAVGVFDLERQGAGRVAQGIDALLREGRVTGYGAWQAGQPLRANTQIFNEAARCARWIKDNWFPEH